ncbi:SDR family NAD(P)-dependent oxidoreductase [Mycolicibacter sp. MYC123]|uniref:SDR family NAD(P)-dependent oxidoreductase n=1 Tax=[Mycobacterium] zoologicum TaxID=2872311 RepID=A0ABU5YEI2_9MYCO|nr:MULTISPECIES: SDR family NAD(P)-dependent oxidoreductase [unclassified Mycolicibacter]MEB3048220.1 SDR family NAD(P)-dependent oxidoreductase [Mycolicibacter sp. MYC123]MEB3061745.1 SDR family NAD(P)-dependent oxidoreductase [Mycolicibacter sp. MYC101]
MTLFASRGAVVVGGSRGIGRAVAELLAAHGAGVVVNGRDDGAVDDTVAVITGSGGRAVGLAGAAHVEATAVALVQACREEYGSVDVLINCAGVAEPAGSSILSISGAQFHDLLDAHLGTVFHTCRAAAPLMARQRRGSIVNSGSVAFLGDYGGTGYPAGKAAINGLTQAIAAELAEHGVRANVVCPGAKTRLSTGADYEQHIRGLHARGLLDEFTMAASLDPAPAEYAAPLYAYLASDLAAGVTGSVFLASGGFVGRFDRAAPAVLGYRDHQGTPPWSITELHAMVAGG